MNAQKIKERVYQCIDAHREDILRIGEDIRLHPELGYKEVRTSGIVADVFGRLGLPFEQGLALTGVKTTLPGGAPGASKTVAYLGELDSVLVRDHPDADPETGAAHACGHNAQIAALIALAYGIVEADVMEKLSGNVVLMAVPAEEYVEVAYRKSLKEKGVIEFLGGKPELIKIGAFDDVDISLMTHTASRTESGLLTVSGPSNGCVVKQITYTGKASHAGGGPHNGINALKAAMIGLQAIDANRETFKDDDHIRVHPIITKGGELVNVIPADVRMETYVRGASIDAILKASEKVDRSLKAGAMALGAEVTIETIPGYLPRLEHHMLKEVYRSNAVGLCGENGWWESGFGAGSTDMGDVSHIMPAIEANANGAIGTGHGADYRIGDPEVAYLLPAKAAAGTIIDLLCDGAERAEQVLEESPPAMSKQEYLSFMRGIEQKDVWSAG